MATLQDLADDLARDVLATAEDEYDPIIEEISNLIGTSSSTLQEAFMTALRIRLAEQRARRHLETRLADRVSHDVD